MYDIKTRAEFEFIEVLSYGQSQYNHFRKKMGWVLCDAFFYFLDIILSYSFNPCKDRNSKKKSNL